MIWDTNPADLRWDDVDPARHPFDRAAAPGVIRALGPARRVPDCDTDSGDPQVRERAAHEAGLWADAMSHALVGAYGRWVLGWRWSRDGGDYDGGPIGAWCCPPHSVTTPEATVGSVVAAVEEWRAWLAELAARFDTHPLDLARVRDERVLWESAARDVIVEVADRTQGGGGWHGHCRLVLTWFLDRWGVPADVAADLVEEAVDGRFQSWTGPAPDVVAGVAGDLAGMLRPELGAPPASAREPAAERVSSRAPESASEPPPDHLARWLALRETVPWPQASDGGDEGPVVPSCDGAAEDIRAFDGALDPVRARRMLAALDQVRADARAGIPLDFDVLRTWQQHVLGTAELPPFRSLPAFAKSGRERYGIGPETRPGLDRCLAESARGSAREDTREGVREGVREGERGVGRPSLTARAARAHLDVCFFHPFDDGNARAAFLALVFVLAREGVALDAVSLLRRVAFRADDPQDALALVRFIGLHLAESRRTAVGRG